MKRDRQSKILELIQQQNIDTQEDLAECLMKAGFRATQATISRDIRELKLIKITTQGGPQKYVVLPDEDKLNEKYFRVLKDGLISMDLAQNILVVKTVSGMAMAVAAAIDAMELRTVVGSIAGDDTIMIAVKTVEDAQTIRKQIKEVIEIRK